jgi:tripartite-type tricarboxylate transporter receptor subunit TctC
MPQSGRRVFVCGAMAVATAGPSLAQGLPGGVVRLLVGFPPGGGTDVMARLIAEQIRKRGNLRSIIVENRPGATGTLACEALKHAPADGTTIMYAPSATTVLPVLTFRTLPFDPRTDLAPITKVGTVSSVLAVSPTLGVRSLPEYVEWVRADPARTSFGTTALGSTTHFFGLSIAGAYGLRLEPIAYRGAAPLVSDLGAGHVTAGTGGLSDFLSHHQAGKLRILVTSGTRRSSAAPDIPCIAELGFPDRAQDGFYAMFAPGRTPRPVLDALQREIAAAVEEPELRRQLAELGLEPETSTPEALGELLAQDIERWRPIVTASGFRVD